MVDQIKTKPMGLINDVRIGNGIPYTVMFTIMNNSMVDDSYSMLLDQPWLRNAKAFHIWGTTW